jgi:hypothetical protein
MTSATNGVDGHHEANDSNGKTETSGKPTKTVLAIGGTGAQGSSVVRGTPPAFPFTDAVLMSSNSPLSRLAVQDPRSDPQRRLT